MKNLYYLITVFLIGMFSSSTFANDAPAEITIISGEPQLEKPPQELPSKKTQGQQSDAACGPAHFLLENKKYGQARVILESLIEDGENCALYHLGKMYIQGLGVKKDNKKGEELLETARKNGYSKAQKALDSNH